MRARAIATDMESDRKSIFPARCRWSFCIEVLVLQYGPNRKASGPKVVVSWQLPCSSVRHRCAEEEGLANS